MKTLTRSVVISLLLLVMDRSPVHAQSEPDTIGSAAAPVASTTSVRRPAHKFADPSIGLELEYKVDNADVCVAWPEQLQDAACKGMELQLRNLVAYILAQNPQPLSTAVLRYGDGVALVFVMRIPSTDRLVSQKDIDDFLNGVLEGMEKVGPATLTTSGSTPGSRYDRIEINGIEGLRFEAKGDAPRGTAAYAMSRMVGYLLTGEHGQVVIQATTDPQHLPQMREAMGSIVKTVRMPKLARTVRMPKSAQKEFGKTSTFDRLLDSELAPFLMVLIIAGVLTIFERGRRKTRSRQR